MFKPSECLPIPKQCDICGSSSVEFCENGTVYGQNQGDWPYLWHCPDCQAAVGCHPGTKFPLGIMADKETRALRLRCHEVFDQIWKSRYYSRTMAYKWLASKLQIRSALCHIAWLTKQQLETTIAASEVFFNERKKYLERRIEKRKVKKDKQNLYTKHLISNRKKRF